MHISTVEDYLRTSDLLNRGPDADGHHEFVSRVLAPHLRQHGGIDGKPVALKSGAVAASGCLDALEQVVAMDDARRVVQAHENTASF